MAKNNKNTPAPVTDAEATEPVPASEVIQDAAPEAAPAPEAPHAVVEASAPAKILIRAVHGTMIHPFTPMDIRQDAITEVDKIDSWLQSQIDEKKVVIVG